MDVPYAKMTCVMNANMECGKCKQKISEILINVHGGYSIDIDTEQATVKVSGKVNPNMILQVLGVGGKHVKIKSLKFEGEEPSMGGGYPLYPPPPYPHGGRGPYQTVGPYDYPMMMPPYMMLPPPPPPPPPSSVAALPQPPKTLLLEAPPQKSGAAPPPQSSGAAPPPQNSGAVAQPQGSGTSAPATADVAKQAVVTSDKKSKRGNGKQCSIM